MRSVPSLRLIQLVRSIDRFTDATGSLISWLSAPLVAAVSYEVIARHFFGAPTLWAYDVTFMLYGSLFMLGSAYALHKGAHIRTDFLSEKWSIQTRGAIDAVAYLLFFFPALGVFLYVSGEAALYAWQIGETSEQTAWRPLLWPFKAVIPLSCLLLLVQGVSETAKSLYAARTGLEFERKVQVEV
jgi:TRAP-type mannitol/chloroaromatic compound transport system permease small subunit